MAFKKTAIRLIAIVGVTAIVAAVYLWYNFNARSNLITAVPENTNWFFHFQTKEIKKKVTGEKPRYLDSLQSLIPQLPIFKNVKKAEDVGIGLFSDVVLFSTEQGWFALLSVISENKLEHFLSEEAPKEMVSRMITGRDCKYVKASNRHLYFAYKNKACVLFVPSDTVENRDNTEKALAAVFSEKSHKLVTSIPEVKYMYDQNCDVLFYANDGNARMSHGMDLSGYNAKRIWATKNVRHASTSPLWIFHKAGKQFRPSDVDRLLGKDNKITTNQYLNLCFQTMYDYLKPFAK